MILLWIKTKKLVINVYNKYKGIIEVLYFINKVVQGFFINMEKYLIYLYFFNIYNLIKD